MWQMLTAGLGRYLLYIVAALVLALAALGWLYRQEVRAGGETEERLAQTEQTLAQVVERERRTNEVLAAREQERNRLRRETAELKKRIEALKRSTPDVADWMAQPVPAALLDELRKASENPHPAAP